MQPPRALAARRGVKKLCESGGAAVCFGGPALDALIPLKQVGAMRGLILGIAAIGLCGGSAALADPICADRPEKRNANCTAPAVAAGQEQAASAPPSLAPPVTGPLKPNADPLHLDAGPLGSLFVSGVISGLGLTQDHPFPGDKHSRIDLSNGQLILQTTEGPVQFYVQAGAYSLPSLGTSYFRAEHVTDDTFGVLPVAYVKIVPSSNFNIQAGKLLTLQGGENTFTFMNFNVERGLLWNQTNAVNRGVQANYAHGPVSVSVSLNDGFYSGRYNWVSATVGYAVSANDSINAGAAANLGRTRETSFAMPLLQGNGEVYVLSWTRAKGPLTVQFYGQATRVPRDESLGIGRGASTYGAAALGKYMITNAFSLAARAEYMRSTGSPDKSAPSLVYGPGSGAWSLTVTPTWQRGILFVRGEGSYVRAHAVVPGFGLGSDFDERSQMRGLVEAGVLF